MGFDVTLKKPQLDITVKSTQSQLYVKTVNYRFYLYFHTSYGESNKFFINFHDNFEATSLKWAEREDEDSLFFTWQSSLLTSQFPTNMTSNGDFCLCVLFFSSCLRHVMCDVCFWCQTFIANQNQCCLGLLSQTIEEQIISPNCGFAWQSLKRGCLWCILFCKCWVSLRDLTRAFHAFLVDDRKNTEASTAI